MSELFELKKDKEDIIFRLFGLKISFKRNEILKREIKLQNSWDLSNIKNAKKIIIFIVPNCLFMAGGIMSIYTLCDYSRRFCPEAECLIVTQPGKKTYATNDFFENNEKIYRWEQIVKNAVNVKKMILHAPEYLACDFYNSLTKDDIKFLRSIDDLQINFLNQKIEVMPEPQELICYRELTNNITQTTAHKRSATQETCDKWGIPTHWFSVHVDYSKYKIIPFAQKEKLIVISCDENENKEKILSEIRQNLPDYKIETVINITFKEYMNLVAKAFTVITFGEGYDGYLTQPPRVGTVSMAVYNDVFFPDKSWKKLANVYESYDQLAANIIGDIKRLEANPQEYDDICLTVIKKRDEHGGLPEYLDNVNRFYSKKYDYLPTKNDQ
jgi:hypothetical protein